MPQDAGHAFCRCAVTAPMSLFYNFGRNINDSHYYYYSPWLPLLGIVNITVNGEVKKVPVPCSPQRNQSG